MPLPVEARRQQLAATFDQAADRYQRARPEYPDELFEELIEHAGLHPGDELLEVGCATGKATLSLAARGFRITCIELGIDLARAAQRNLAPFPAVTVRTDRFETWTPPPGAAFDLVYAATAWHWVDPEVRYQKAWQVLRPGGHLAVWSATHVFTDDGDPFFGDIQEVYEEIGEGLPADAAWPRPGELDDLRPEVEGSGLFEVVAIHHLDWEVTYDANGYIDLLDTFSGHIAMQEWQRRRLYGEIRRRLAARPDGRLRRHWGTVLNLSRRRE